jgi:hypothetical protein
VVDGHLLATADVELVGDEGVDEVPRQLRVALERRQGRDAPALVLVAVLERGTDGECRHLVEEEVEPVVVVDDDCDVRLVLLQPLAHRRIAVEERLPVGVVEQLAGDGVADRGDVGGSDAAYDPGHVVILPASPAFP